MQCFVAASAAPTRATASGAASLSAPFFAPQQQAQQAVTRSSADLVQGRSQARPNVLFLFPDQWRADWDGRDETRQQIPLRMPTLRRLQEKGTRFSQAYVPSPLCGPSRASLASGREYDYAGVLTNAANDYDLDTKTVFSALQDAGYWTMTAGKDDLTKSSSLGHGLGKDSSTGLYNQAKLGFSDGIRCAGKAEVLDHYPNPFEPYGLFLARQIVTLMNGTNLSAWQASHDCMNPLYPEHPNLNANETACQASSFPQALYQDDWTTSNAETLLERAPTGRPWFLMVSFPGPHAPFITTAPMAESARNRSWPEAVDRGDNLTTRASLAPLVYNRTDFRRAPCHNNLGQPGLGYERCNYGAEIENLDGLFQRVLDAVDARGELESTIVCVFSDHGDLLMGLLTQL